MAVALAAVQVLPVLEFARQSRRVSGERAINSYNFSLDPFRVVELVWPNLFGTNWPENRSWIQAVPPAGDHPALDRLALLGRFAPGARPQRIRIEIRAAVAPLADDRRSGRARGKFRQIWEPALVGAVRPIRGCAGLARPPLRGSRAWTACFTTAPGASTG